MAEQQSIRALMVYPQGDCDWVDVLGADEETGAAVVRLPDGRKVWTSTDSLTYPEMAQRNATLNSSKVVHRMGSQYANGSPATSCSASADGKVIRWTDKPVTCKACLKAA